VSTKLYRIYSLGTSLRSAEEFLQLLKCYKIEAIIDVRRFPVSRLLHFNREPLMELLTGHGIHYHYLGRELGGYRKGGYEAYTKSKDFTEGLGRLESIAQRSMAAFMCAELLPWRCHRRFIGQSLTARGWEVIHIIDKDRVWQPG